MIYIKDDFLPQELLDRIEEDKSSYEEVVTPGKSFWVKHASTDFIVWICSRISEIEGVGITPILGFFREAKEGQDNDWRIHNDSIIEGQLPDRAAVLYISDSPLDRINGTAFWEHKIHGDTFENINPEEYNRLLIEDSNDQTKWNLKSVIGHKKNRLISYPCNYFHSKFPKEFIRSRRVFVIFYKIEK